MARIPLPIPTRLPPALRLFPGHDTWLGQRAPAPRQPAGTHRGTSFTPFSAHATTFPPGQRLRWRSTDRRERSNPPSPSTSCSSPPAAPGLSATLPATTGANSCPQKPPRSGAEPSRASSQPPSLTSCPAPDQTPPERTSAANCPQPHRKLRAHPRRAWPCLRWQEKPTAAPAGGSLRPRLPRGAAPPPPSPRPAPARRPGAHAQPPASGGRARETVARVRSVFPAPLAPRLTSLGGAAGGSPCRRAEPLHVALPRRGGGGGWLGAEALRDGRAGGRRLSPLPPYSPWQRRTCASPRRGCWGRRRRAGAWLPFSAASPMGALRPAGSGNPEEFPGAVGGGGHAVGGGDGLRGPGRSCRGGGCETGCCPDPICPEKAFRARRE